MVAGGNGHGHGHGHGQWCRYSKLICYLCVNSCVQVWQKLLQLIAIDDSNLLLRE
jgi:hypothetical protein